MQTAFAKEFKTFSLSLVPSLFLSSPLAEDKIGNIESEAKNDVVIQL